MALSHGADPLGWAHGSSPAVWQPYSKGIPFYISHEAFAHQFSINLIQTNAPMDIGQLKSRIEQFEVV